MTDKNGSEFRLKDKERRIFSDFFVLQLKRFGGKIKKQFKAEFGISDKANELPNNHNYIIIFDKL